MPTDINRQSVHGFTVVELLIVIVVIAVLAAITVVTYAGIRDRARYATMRQDFSSITRALQIYYAEHQEYPNSADCASTPGEYNYASLWCGWDQGRDDSFIPGLVPLTVGQVPNLSKNLPYGDTYLYQSRNQAEDATGTAKYQLIRLRTTGLSRVEMTDNPDHITVNGYDGIAWGLKSDATSDWW